MLSFIKMLLYVPEPRYSFMITVSCFISASHVYGLDRSAKLI
jgi:hypothetical protein